jgi:hypothetical protein
MHNLSLSTTPKPKRGGALSAYSLPITTPLHFYFKIKQEGLESVSHLLPHIPASLLKTCIDLDGWEKDSFCAADVLVWLQTCCENTPDRFVYYLDMLDEEVQALLLQACLAIYPTEKLAPLFSALPEEPDGGFTTPDGCFIIKTQDSDDMDLDLGVCQQWILSLYGDNPFQAQRRLLAAYQEPRMLLEEDAYRFRSARLADLGFLDSESAMDIFALPPTTSLSQRKTPLPKIPGFMHLPAPYQDSLEKAEAYSFAQALQELPPDVDQGLLMQELSLLLHRAVIAYGKSIRDFNGACEVARNVYANLSLGLEYLSHKTQPKCNTATLLNTVPLKLIFQHGVALLRPLAQAAWDASITPILATETSATKPFRLQCFLRSLRKKPHPAYVDIGTTHEAVPFSRLEQLYDAAQRLQAIPLAFSPADSSCHLGSYLQQSLVPSPA